MACDSASYNHVRLDQAAGLFGFERSAMSAYGTKRTSLVAPHMSAFGGKADMALRELNN
jgi:hypothetical protein